MTDRLGSASRLPAAERVAADVLDKLDQWSQGRGNPPRVWLRGEPGAGKSAALSCLAADLKARAIDALHLQVPEIDLDGPFHLTLQLAARQKELGANGTLDVTVRHDVPLSTKANAVFSELERRSKDTVLLLDWPRSWTRASDVEPLGIAHVASSLRERLHQVARDKKMPIVVAGPILRDTNIYFESYEIGATSEERLLEDESRWGELFPFAEQLASVLGNRTSVMSPIALRLGVALLALGVEAATLPLYASGPASLLELLQQKLEERPALASTFRLLTLPRFPLPRDAVETLIDPGLSDVERAVAWVAFLLEYPLGFALHSTLRRVHLPERMMAAGNELPELHARVVATLGERPRPTSLPSTVAECLPIVEYAYHAARAGSLEAARSAAMDVSALCEIGRALSLMKRHGEALQIYEEALAIDPSNEYARAYVAYHLKLLGREPKRANKLFAALHDERPENAWWARRYVRSLIDRGRIGAARDAWVKAVGTISRPDDDSRSAWLAMNFHAGVARGFLDHGALKEAREVLSHVGAAARHDIAELRLLWNRLQHMDEAERLGVAPFPLVVSFEDRWEHPHVLSPRSLRNVADQWFPGRMASIGDEAVVLELVERPGAATPPRPFRLTLTRDQFLEAARRTTTDGIEPNQFLELGVQGDHRYIDFHPVRERGIEIGVGFLRDVPARR